ncbi:MAG: bifunctional folylpolyglutamate synthase/dihydrofolate synthase [Pirellulales bacterium]|nr:bifunctional folylpolyglutamate synthase/dihydrofolate synthase [Pirellulales bacterium]
MPTPAIELPIADGPREYHASLEFLQGRINYERTDSVPYSGRSFKLDRMRYLLEQLGDPQSGQQIVHIGGTKGKGSTAAMVSSILTASGRTVGTYSSPHLDRLEERMAINGRQCSERELVELVDCVRPIVDQMDAETDTKATSLGRPTYFEIVTAMAFVHFARAGACATVLEVGLGGRLDSTNVCEPLLSVITSISFDHTKQLGSTLAAIAGEKAGIIKPGVPVVSGVVEPEPRDVIRRVAEERGSQLIELRREFDVAYHPPHRIDYAEIGASESATTLKNVDLSLLGKHQAANAALAIAAIDVLRTYDWEISDDAIRAGLANAPCPARIEVIPGEPNIVIDAAHNVASVEALLATLDESFVGGRRVLVFATTQDKDVRSMLEVLLPAFEKVILTRYLKNPRYVSPADLGKIANCVSPHCQQSIIVSDGPAEAWQLATENADADDLICVTGSFFIAAEIRQLIRRAYDH